MKNTLNKVLRKFGAEIHGLGYLQALQKGEFSKDVFQVQQDLLKERGVNVKTIFDLGANSGDIAKRYIGMYPGAVVHAFEPFPGSFDKMKERLGTHPSVVCNQLGIADKEGVLPFYVNENMDTNSLLKPTKMGLSSDKQVENKSVMEVRCITVDMYCAEHGIKNIDLLKMDIQGGEYNALKGCDSLLKEKKVGLLYMESYFREQYERQPLFHDISKLLHSYGYYLQDIYNPIYGKKSLAWSDVIFLPGN